MKLLIVTQVIDTEHPILGFFHRWVAEFAKHCEHVHIICLEAGRHSLPANVTIHSLGKESGTSKLTQLWHFWQYSWRLRQEYDAVFVHMIPLYVLIGAPIWKVLRKKIGMWYAHGAVSWQLRLAIVFCSHVFTSTEEGLRVQTKKKQVVGQGIDTDVFRPGEKTASDTLRLITVGRIAPSKTIDTLLKACAELHADGIQFHFHIIGNAITECEQKYEKEMRQLASELNLDAHVGWIGPVSQAQLPTYLQQADMFIHDGATNSLDKALLEAVLCGCVVVSSNPAFKNIAQEYTPELLYTSGKPTELAEIMKQTNNRNLDQHKGVQPLQSFICNEYSVSKLISGIVHRI